jgi:hypothetical protein
VRDVDLETERDDAAHVEALHRHRTPGPWMARPLQGAGRRHWLVVPAGTWGTRTIAGVDHVNAHAAEANARLIAAAPDLLAAVEELVGMLEAWEMTQEEDERGREVGELPAVKLARAALARARGGA